MEVDGCYIIWSNAKSKRKKKHTEENNKKIEQSALIEWLHKKCNLKRKIKSKKEKMI